MRIPEPNTAPPSLPAVTSVKLLPDTTTFPPPGPFPACRYEKTAPPLRCALTSLNDDPSTTTSLSE